MAIKELPVFSYFDKQRFNQFSPMDSANFYTVQSEHSKKGMACYPAMGRRRIKVLDEHKLIFDSEPRFLASSIDFVYAIVSDTVYQIDSAFNAKNVSQGVFTKTEGDVWFDFLPTPDRVFAVFADNDNIFVLDESESAKLVKITDPNRPKKPNYVAAFGNRIVISNQHSTEFQVSRVNLDGSSFNSNTVFTIGSQTVFAQEAGIIRQMAVLHNQLFIFTDFFTSIWSNNSTSISDGGTIIPFPFRKNTSYNFDYGIADPKTLDVDFGLMVWLGKSRNGLVQVVASSGGRPKPISTKAVDTLLENRISDDDVSPFLTQNTFGFLYQYENSIFYRLSAGQFLDLGVNDVKDNAESLEYNFSMQRWHRCIELNGERNRIQRHAYLNHRHLVTVQDDGAIYEMSGRVYTNDKRNSDIDAQADNAFKTDPMRYEMVTQIISEKDYSEFITDWIQIDFVFGESIATKYDSPYPNAEFIIDEETDPDGCPIYITDEDGSFLVTEDSDKPTALSTVYNQFFQPHIELWVSDDGGQRFYSADVREFSDLGTFRWRMRWYELGASRNRVYKLICVSPSPIVLLGGIMNVRNVSGGAR